MYCSRLQHLVPLLLPLQALHPLSMHRLRQLLVPRPLLLLRAFILNRLNLGLHTRQPLSHT